LRVSLIAVLIKKITNKSIPIQKFGKNNFLLLTKMAR
jgi:hypothetical protein